MDYHSVAIWNVKRIRERELGSTWLRRDKNRIRTLLKDKTQSYWHTKKYLKGGKSKQKGKVLSK